MNPRVSRSSALASKATGFPIARVGAKLAVGYHLDELPNDITKTTPASFEPVLDYVVVKLPRFAFEKFPEVDPMLGVQMKAVGETMAIGRTFRSAWQKGFRGLEIDRHGWVTGERLKDDGLDADDPESASGGAAETHGGAALPAEAGHGGRHLPWTRSSRPPRSIRGSSTSSGRSWSSRAWYRELAEVTPEDLRLMKREGFSDLPAGGAEGRDGDGRSGSGAGKLGIRPTYNVVDTCAGEFPAATPYYYSSYESENESKPSDREKIVILGSGPNRIGQGIEFDYCCVQAVMGLNDAGYETIMINSNPETVSTDFDVSDKLYFEPLTLEDVLEIIHLEKPKGVIVQLGGQTPLKLAEALEELGAPILGTSVDAIDRAEDRERFAEVCEIVGARVPENGVATSEEQGTGGSQLHRIPGPGSAQLRPGGAGHGDRL